MGTQKTKVNALKEINIKNKEYILSEIRNTENEKEFSLEESYDMNVSKLKKYANL